MSKKQVKVIIDIHEPPEITGVIDRHPDVESYSLAELPAADIEIDGIGFERKTIGDYASSLMEGRLEDQLRKLGQRYEHAYILIDGDLSETESPFKTSMNGSSLRGHMASVTAREDSGVRAAIPCSSSDLLADMAVRLARKHVEESDDAFVPRPVEDPDASTALMMYCCIPGVGPKTAKALEAEYPSLTIFCREATVDSLQEIEGIGEKKALQIIEELV